MSDSSCHFLQSILHDIVVFVNLFYSKIHFILLKERYKKDTATSQKLDRLEFRPYNNKKASFFRN